MDKTCKRRESKCRREVERSLLSLKALKNSEMTKHRQWAEAAWGNQETCYNYNYTWAYLIRETPSPARARDWILPRNLSSVRQQLSSPPQRQPCNLNVDDNDVGMLIRILTSQSPNQPVQRVLQSFCLRSIGLGLGVDQKRSSFSLGSDLSRDTRRSGEVFHLQLLVQLPLPSTWQTKLQYIKFIKYYSPGDLKHQDCVLSLISTSSCHHTKDTRQGFIFLLHFRSVLFHVN